jgi:hypothetical protein
MKKTAALALSFAVCLLMTGSVAWAKLPPLSDEAKAKAAEAAAKAAHAGKVDGYKLCKSMDQVAATYFEQAKKAGKTVPVAPQMAPCADPGAFVYAPPAPAAPAAGSTVTTAPATTAAAPAATAAAPKVPAAVTAAAPAPAAAPKK